MVIFNQFYYHDYSQGIFCSVDLAHSEKLWKSAHSIIKFEIDQQNIYTSITRLYCHTNLEHAKEKVANQQLSKKIFPDNADSPLNHCYSCYWEINVCSNIKISNSMI